MVRLLHWTEKSMKNTTKKNFVLFAMNLDTNPSSAPWLKKWKTKALEVKDLAETQKHDGGGSVQVFAAVMNMELEQERTVV